MAECLELAKTPRGLVSPNPYVGAVIVKDGKIIGRGYHRGPGKPHGEIEAINSAQASVEGATIYCNLEPCCHTNKRTPPCAQRLIKEKIKKVVIANLDPNPQVAGNGVKLLREAGIEVVSGVLNEEGLELNEVFFKHIVEETPFVHLKWAQTLDGKIATKSKSSKWITSEAAREKVHWERLAYDAILVGASTLRDDDPSLTARKDGQVEKEITRIAVASKADFDQGLKFFSDERKDKSLLLLPEGAKSEMDVETLYCPPTAEGRVDLEQALKLLYKRGIHSIYVEGGSSIITQFFKNGLYDRVSVYIAPKVLGDGISPIGDLGIDDMNKAPRLQEPRIETLEDNIFITAKGTICSQD